MESLDCSANRDIVEQVVGHMVQKSVESGIVRRAEMVLILEDMIQSLERGTLAVALENA
ncbi:MAG TPA: hypothetical protein VGQ03_10745 [Nitrososphaera sp.]|jgi:hypothetical protein|nr:hypothetical protein [Nitrososphaera sp.]